MLLLYNYFKSFRLYSNFKFFRVMSIKKFLELRQFKNFDNVSIEYKTYCTFLIKFYTYMNEHKPLPSFLDKDIVQKI